MTVLITGANCGLGYYCAKTILASAPTYHVVVATRDEGRALSAIDHLTSETGNPNVSFLQIDLASLSSVRSAASRLAAFPNLPLTALILNAGIGPGASDGSERSVDGFEKIWATNHLGHFVFANLIRDNLAPDCHIVVVSSNLHTTSPERTNGIPIISPLHSGPRSQDSNPPIRTLKTLQCLLRLRTHADDHRNANQGKRIQPWADARFRIPETADARAPPGTAACVDMGGELAELAIADGWKSGNGHDVNRGVDAPSSKLSHNGENAKELWETSSRLAGLESTF
jgi:NAD(P)-dependent dehydrogenase (short-subunit alcohol dehydrogenase family)